MAASTNPASAASWEGWQRAPCAGAAPSGSETGTAGAVALSVGSGVAVPGGAPSLASAVSSPSASRAPSGVPHADSAPTARASATADVLP